MKKNKKHKCGKWDHDFSYEGKISAHKIKCNRCGVNMVEWVSKMKEEIDKRMDCAGRSM